MKNQCAVAVATEVSDLSSLVLKNVSHLLTSAAFKLIFCSCISVEVYQWCTICGLTVQIKIYRAAQLKNKPLLFCHYIVLKTRQ